MARETFEVIPGEVSQAEWDAKFAATTEALKDMGGADSKDSDDLPEGETNIYDTGVPPSNLDELSDGSTRKAMSDTEKAHLASIEPGAEVNPANLGDLDPEANTKLGGIETGATGDQTGEEVRDAIVAIAEADRKIVVTEPLTGDHKIYEVHINPAGNIAGNSEADAEE